MEEHKGHQKQWEGVWTKGSQAHQTQLHGPSSSFYFLTRLRAQIGSTLQLPYLDCHLQPNTASRFFASPASSPMNNSEEEIILHDGHMISEDLSRAQEDYFLGLFWQSHHCTIPILDELDFRKHYESLWAGVTSSNGRSRKRSALVDIILALCMQYGTAFISRSETDKTFEVGVDSNDSSIAGRGFYRRCQTLLAYSSETPSIMTLQCQIFSAIYLRDASFLNMAHSTLAVATRTAHTLGLHQEPTNNISRAEVELRRRLWWVTYALESKACMALGRPWLAQISHINCALPADDQDLARLSGPNFPSSIANVTWLSYHLHYVRLILAARAVHTAFEQKCSKILSANGGKILYDDAQGLEALAGFLSQCLQCMWSWAQNVPDTLKTERKAGGKPMSTDRSALEVDLIAPQWLQRQRLLLELLHHNLVMNLYRPFICFSKPPSSSTPLADDNAISCLNHAIAITNIILQTLTGTDILNGWHEAYQFQWNATLSMIGFMFAYPVCPPTFSARKTINSAIAVFEIFRNNFAVAASAANVTRDLAGKADLFIDRFRGGSTSAPQSQEISVPAVSSLPALHNGFSMSLDSETLTDPEDAIMTNLNPFSGTLGLDFNVDPSSGFKWPLPESNGMSADIWPPFVNE